MKKISFWILALILTGILVGGANSQTKISGSQIRNGAIDSVHLSSDLVAQLAFLINDSAVAYANVAITIKDGVITSADFTASLLDSIQSFLVEHADTADVVLSLSTGALNDSLQMSSSFRDGIFGRGATPWVYKARRAGEADSSLTSDYATEAGIADSARTAPVNDSAEYADRAGVADIALVAVSVDDAAGDSSVNWDALTDLVQAAIKTDSVQRATRADSISAGGIDAYGMFSTAIKDTYLLTGNLRRGLNGAGTAITGSNPVVDSTTLYSNFVKNVEGAARPVHVDLNSAPTAIAGNVVGITIDTANGLITINDMSDTRFTFEDSAAIRSWIATGFADYVLTGTKDWPARLTVDTVAASGGSNFDLWVNTADTTFSVKIAGSWVDIAGGGGGGSPTSVSTSAGVIDADSLVRTSAAWNTEMYGIYNMTNALNIGGVGDAGIQTIYNGSLFQSYGTMKVESLLATDPDDGYTGNQILVGSDTIVGPIYIGREDDVNNQPYIFARTVNVSSELSIESGAQLVTGSIYPQSDATSVIGSNNFRYGDVVSTEFSAIGTTDSIVIKEAGVTLYRVPLNITNDDITVSGGSITSPNVNISSGPQLSSTGIDLAASDYINVPSTSTIRIQSGSEILIKDDSVGFADIDNTSIKYHVVEDSIWAAGIAACPDPSATNPVITKQYLKEFVNFKYPNPDTIYSYRTTPRLYARFKYTGCDDSLWFGGNNANQIVFPVIEGTPIEWTQNQQIVMPWAPVILPPPMVIDSAANSIFHYSHGPSYPEHIIKVSSKFDPRWGYLTGEYATLNQALDSLPNIRCNLGGDVPNKATDPSNPDTFFVKTNTAYSGAQIKFYRGNVAAHSGQIQDTLPDFITQAGVYVKFEKTGDDDNRWCQIIEWVNDSIFVIQDSVMQDQFNSIVSDTAWELTFANKVTVNVFPPIEGGVIPLADTVQIGDYCPVHIKGLSKESVVITNGSSVNPSTKMMFNCRTPASYDYCYIGMPIEFSDITVFYDSVSTATKGPFNLSGNVTFRDMNVIARMPVGLASDAVVIHDYVSPWNVRGKEPSVLFENVAFILDSDAVVLELRSDSTFFQSYQCAYSISGDSGSIYRPSSNVWPNAASRNLPTFSYDQFFLKDGADIAASLASQSFDTLAIVHCQFIGADPSTSSNILRNDWNDPVPNMNNVYSSLITAPPVKLIKGSLPIVVKFAPK